MRLQNCLQLYHGVITNTKYFKEERRKKSKTKKVELMYEDDGINCASHHVIIE
jgi:hypothetical protein